MVRIKRKALLLQKGEERSVIILIQATKDRRFEYEAIDITLIIDNDYLDALAMQGYILM